MMVSLERSMRTPTTRSGFTPWADQLAGEASGLFIYFGIGERSPSRAMTAIASRGAAGLSGEQRVERAGLEIGMVLFHSNDG